ncbi:MAG TPA: sensor domain-containing protein [Streptosporangiaceae bacterium]|nr:sensor domain-containing protein [Streptosporangiaceae bacterium]
MSSADVRLTLRQNPIRLVFSASLWRAAGFLGSYLLISGVLFTVALTASVTAAALGFTLAAFPLLIAAAWVVHGCASVQRGLLALAFRTPVTTSYRRSPAGSGLIIKTMTAWRQKGTWRELGYLVGLHVPLLALDATVFTLWLTFAAGVTVPFWYDRVANEFNGHQVNGLNFGAFPHGPHGPGGEGLFVDNLPKALLVAGIALILFLLFNYVLVLTARMHARVARATLRKPADPLAAAKSVLTTGGPLGPLRPTSG